MQDRGYRKATTSLLWVVIFFHPLLLSASPAQRVAAPADIPCSRDHLTLYNGRVLALSRSTRRTTIRIRTDYDTSETVTLSHSGSGSPLQWFRLSGEPFRQSHWRLIESARNRLKRGVRANIWVCDDGSNPIVDWQPPK
jgi:hypothetical protein